MTIAISSDCSTSLAPPILRHSHPKLLSGAMHVGHLPILREYRCGENHSRDSNPGRTGSELFLYRICLRGNEDNY